MTVITPDHFDGILDSFGVSVVSIDSKGIVVEVNPPTLELTGYREEELLGSPASVFVHEKLLNDPKCVEQINRIVVEGHYKHRTGEEIPVSFATRLMTGPVPGSRRIILCATRLQNSQQTLQISEDRFRDFAQASSDWFWETGVEDEFIFISDVFFEKMKLDRAKILGRRRLEAISRNELDSNPGKWREHLEALSGHHAFRDFCYSVIGGDGLQRHIKISGAPAFDGSGKFTGYRGSGADVTEAKAAEDVLRQSAADLRESKHRLTAMMNSVPYAVITIDQDSIIQSFNPFAERIFGYSVADAVGQNVSILMPEAMGHEHDGYVRNFSETGGSGAIGKRREVVGRRKNGELFPLEIAVNWMELPDAIMFVGVCQDITRRKQAEQERTELEQELLQSHKMESLGTLSGGIAHEINTPMQYVGDNIRFLEESFADLSSVLLSYAELQTSAAAEGAATEAVEKVRAAIKTVDLDYLREEIPTAITQSLDGVMRVSEIVEAIKRFSHPGSKERTPTKIAEAIQTTLTIARNHWKYVAEVTTDFDESLPDVPCVPGEFNQVMLNLIVNAAHAVAGKGGKGHITISAGQCEDWLEVRVSDDGMGIPEENLEKIFEPFYTTKEPGMGSGQGLAISHTIVTKSHHGTMTVESEVGKGTTFLIRIPLLVEVQLGVAS